MKQVKNTTIETNNAALRENVQALTEAVRELQAAVFGREQQAPSPAKPAWSLAEPPVRDWEPVQGRPGVFRDPNGIWQWADKGEVPQSVIDRFREHVPDDSPTFPHDPIPDPHE